MPQVSYLSISLTWIRTIKKSWVEIQAGIFQNVIQSNRLSVDIKYFVIAGVAHFQTYVVLQFEKFEETLESVIYVR